MTEDELRQFFDELESRVMTDYSQPLLEPIEEAIIHLMNADPVLVQHLAEALNADSIEDVAKKIADHWWDHLRGNAGENDEKDDDTKGEQ